jgi:hypothetical protein
MQDAARAEAGCSIPACRVVRVTRGAAARKRCTQPPTARPHALRHAHGVGACCWCAGTVTGWTMRSLICRHGLSCCRRLCPAPVGSRARAPLGTLTRALERAEHRERRTQAGSARLPELSVCIMTSRGNPPVSFVGCVRSENVADLCVTCTPRCMHCRRLPDDAHVSA